MALAWRSKWLDWQPGDKIISAFPETEPPKPPKPPFEGFEGAISGESQIISAPADNPDAWRQDFARWRAERCVSRQGYEDSAGIGCLLVDFAEWCIKHDAVPCQRTVFEQLLHGAGFPLKDGFAGGLLLKVDWEAHCAFRDAPAKASAGRGRG